MRIASNKLKDMIHFYHKELEGMYDTNEIEALLSLAAEYYIGFSKTDLITKTENNINQSDVLKLYDCCKDLKRGIPIQYLLGETWFYSLKFKVNSSVLIPRPETEELVDLILKENKTTLSFLDIGTGSGCIPICIKKNNPGSTVYAIDISAEALTVAISNARLNKVEVVFIEGSVLGLPSLTKLLVGEMDVIVSNPPYIKSSEKKSMTQQVLDHEPHLALFVEDEDAIIFYKRIIDLCKTHLVKSGRLYFELNPLTAESVKEYARNSSLFKNVELIKDMSGKLRFLRAERN